MRRPVRLTPRAYRDLLRLVDFLAEANPNAARRARDVIVAGLNSLETLSEGGRPLSGGRRELPIRFGRYADVSLYRVDDDAVVIAKIRHSHESD